ncbi:glycoside hydrolase domain-containing protein [Companilactobacillus sp.]|jgi:peptidoglycan hydrolase-like protein with peptidoglycan-binding domain|uniref:glycoside hydrolase domain-containing protein n=1 Tax=Companilactobacillus sp. TaxID=2767905 RepID=UPI0025C1278D|nr:glycoside hydrolase domain-containing protein [Companilactobacillus sp.]MCH4008502.1 DUF1906 domain-containing protein [Companilactobacillus sp.]MCH4051319.1 DUF1906 domain-containing protein [Companilactobacillus sp.]MCH4076445.1 DUF1906 domain-containing protein [Companilactobacillus sp.]MCH4125020.1 DUF1906 domain-containing protein [Companilactobacillus sp.]MCH4131562.1 DUF1906 domain-containing protein [Companilactobacillus sp.]
MDEWVLKTQKWVNKKYAGISGYERCPENGNTGWKTIYSLREGLQHELGISPVSSGYGPATELGVSNILNKLVNGYSSNIVRLIQGAFWCKGISPSDFDGRFSAKTQKAIEILQKNAGIPANGTMTGHLMRALFDMSAFVLVQSGSSKIRSMQQYLNGSYNKYFGILPCDGIYQRDTNTALIYALQAVEGMDPSTANGFYGPGTINKTPTLRKGDSGEAVTILQYGLLVNGFYEGPFDGTFSSKVSDAVISFRKFMNLSPISETADLTVIKGLLTSNGDTNRDSIACDTSTQLNERQIVLLKKYGFYVVGRYLTGTVGVGAQRRNKNLTNTEIAKINKAGISIFPIYQDGGWDQSYFTSGQGAKDARLARSAALKLGFPTGSTIYFAVDVDIEGGNIQGSVIPYIRAVRENLYDFKIGIYGTRNVCSSALKAGYAKSCFVSDMSTGYSGNLGFKMPNNWSFDQFIEYSIGDLPIDQVASSGKDDGVRKFQNVSIPAHKAVNELFGDLKFSFEKKMNLMNFGWLTVDLLASKEVNLNASNNGVISIENGKISSSALSSWLSKAFNTNADFGQLIFDQTGKMQFISKIKKGVLEISSTLKSNFEYVTKLTVTVFELMEGPVEDAFSVILQATIKPKEIPGALVEVLAMTDDFLDHWGMPVAIGLAGVIVVICVGGPGALIVTATSVATELIAFLVLAVKALEVVR